MNIVDFFSTSFDDFEFSIFPKKIAGPGAGKSLLGTSWGVLGGPEEHLGRSWGGSWGSGGRLGRVLGGLGAILEWPFEQSDFGFIF